jgi:hypothetical protein
VLEILVNSPLVHLAMDGTFDVIATAKARIAQAGASSWAFKSL